MRGMARGGDADILVFSKRRWNFWQTVHDKFAFVAAVRIGDSGETLTEVTNQSLAHFSAMGFPSTCIFSLQALKYQTHTPACDDQITFSNLPLHTSASQNCPATAATENRPARYQQPHLHLNCPPPTTTITTTTALISDQSLGRRLDLGVYTALNSSHGSLAHTHNGRRCDCTKPQPAGSAGYDPNLAHRGLRREVVQQRRYSRWRCPYRLPRPRELQCQAPSHEHMDAVVH